MQPPLKPGLISRLLGASFFPAAALAQASQPSSSGPVKSDPQAWETDPRWGREHWRIRREPIQWPKNEHVAAVFAVTFGFPDLNFKVPDGGGYSGTVARIHTQMYGVKAGVWRLLDILRSYNVKASFEISGICAEQFPEAVKEISRDGHEIVACNWADNVIHDQLSADQDRQWIRRTLSAIEKVTGKRPTGWVAPRLRLGPRTLQFLTEEGIEWHACDLSDELPFVIHVEGKKMLAIPHAEEHFEDSGFIIGTRRPPEVFLEVLKAGFRTLYREGQKMPKMFNLGVHPELGGRPFFADAIEDMLGYLKSFPDVWLTTRQNIADWWTQRKYS